MVGPHFSGTARGALAGGRARLCGAFVVGDDSGTMALAEEGAGGETLAPTGWEAVLSLMRAERRFVMVRCGCEENL